MSNNVISWLRIIAGFTFLLGVSEKCSAQLLFSDSFDEFVFGTAEPNGYSYSPPGSPTFVTLTKIATSSISIADIAGSTRLAYDCPVSSDTANYNDYLARFPVQESPVLSVSWELRMGALRTNAGFGGALLQLPLSSEDESTVVAFADGGQIYMVTNVLSSVSDLIKVGSWASLAGTTMTNQLVANYLTRTMSLWINGQFIATNPLRPDLSSTVDHIEFEFSESSQLGALGNSFALDSIAVRSISNGAPQVTFATLHRFGVLAEGQDPVAALTTGSNGNFYGTTYGGGINGSGTVFKITPSGGLTTLYGFTGGRDGANPEAALTLGSDGNFYGTTTAGGSGDNGTVFRISPTGSLTLLYSFSGASETVLPRALVEGSDGNLYGTTYGGGLKGFGMVFKITPGGVFASLYSFTNGVDGAHPAGALTLGSNGYLYGTTLEGGSGTNEAGTVFQISPAGVLTALYSFTGADDGGGPGALVQGADGNFYGTTYAGGNGAGTIFKITPAGELTLLYALSGGNGGANPSAALVQDSKGNFYGTTENGGVQGGFWGDGTVFKISPAGVFTSLYSFTNGFDGANPTSALTPDEDGNFYGTDGAVFKISSSGAFTTLQSFAGNNDGAEPTAALALGSEGNFYGTTDGGLRNEGTVFRISASGNLSLLHSFTNGADGEIPVASLALGNDGSFYGTSSDYDRVGRGGTNWGAIFKIDEGGLFTSLYFFTNGTDGAYPYASLIRGNDGDFYGTTLGNSFGPGHLVSYGTVFKISASGVFTPLHPFTGGNDGAYPTAALVLGGDGNFYGTAQRGGTANKGVVFQISPGGVFKSLYSFTNGLDGANPTTALTLGGDGNFYGTTYNGGTNDWG